MRILLAIFLCVFPAHAMSAAEPLSAIQIEADKVKDGIYMLRARGGNIGVSIGDDGTFLIDDQYAPLTQKIRARLDELAGDASPVRFVLNTHVHGDHTGGNENLGKAGALIVAHENVRKRMGTEEFREQFLQSGGKDVEEALPVVTFNDRITFHVNGSTLSIRHYPRAHTDGDSVVWFEEQNVVHMGDIYFEIGFPFIDIDRGGTVDGLIGAVEDVLSRADDKTVIMPGHGRLSDKAGLREYRDMLLELRDRVRAELQAGKSLEEILAAGLAVDYEERWSWAFINDRRFIETLVRDANN